MPLRGSRRPASTAHPRRRAAVGLRAPLAAAVLALSVVTIAAPATAAPALTIAPLTWNVIGLDSNSPATAGPDTFPVGARICNTGDAPADAVSSSLVFDSASTVVTLVGQGTVALGSLAAGSCVDAYFNVVVQRSAASFDQSRRYRITATATGLGTVTTPADRELVVERLVSQARNAVLGISGSAIEVPPTSSAPGRATLVVGRTYTFTVTSKTATGGYEQLESFLNFPNTIFQVLSVNATYAQPPGATNDSMYADACGWDNTIGPRPPTGTYLSCVGPARYAGGKAGGDPIVTTYTVKVIAAGTGRLGTLIYDFSGSSFHYNGDFGANLSSVAFEAVTAPDLAIAKAHSGDFARDSNGSYAISVTNVGGSAAPAPTTVTDTLPADLGFVSATGDGWACTASGQVVTCTRSTAIAGGASAPAIALVVAVSPTAPASVTNTATVSNADDANATNDTASDPTTITAAAPPDQLPVARNDTAVGNEDAPVTIGVTGNDSLGDTPTAVTAHTQGASGSVACSATACTYTPRPNFNGADSFNYTITDADGDESTASVTVTITPVNDPPLATDDAVTTASGTPVTIAVVGNDADVDGDTLTVVTAAPAAANGTVSCSATACTYTPRSGFSGTDTFTYAITDGNGGTSTATVTVTVSAPTPPAPIPTPPVESPAPSGGGIVPSVPAPANQPPRFAEVASNAAQTIAVGGLPAPLLVDDPNGDRMTVAVVSGALPDGVTLSPAGVFGGTATRAGVFNAGLRVCDDAASPLCTERPLTVTVLSAAAERSVDAGDTLPRTGAGLERTAFGGGLLLAFGSLLVLASRRAPGRPR